MKRLFSVLVLMFVMTGGSAAAGAGNSQSGRPADFLGDRRHGPRPAQARGGWCGEAAIQMALSYYGAYASQQAINRAGRPQHPDLYAPEIPRAMRNLGLESSPWRGDGLDSFLKWIRGHLAEGHPVLLGVKIYPTAHPEWALDHFVLAVGCSEDALTLNTTWGRAETKTLARLSAEDKGLSFANRYGTYFGYAITGLKTEPPPAGLRPTRVTIARDGDKQVKLGISMRELERGKRYRLLKFTDLAGCRAGRGKGRRVAVVPRRRSHGGLPGDDRHRRRPRVSLRSIALTAGSSLILRPRDASSGSRSAAKARQIAAEMTVTTVITPHTWP